MTAQPTAANAGAPPVIATVPMGREPLQGGVSRADPRYVRREYPTFSWSHTREQTFETCARRYYWQYYGSHNGWERGASGIARQAWMLKQLTTYPLTLGTAIHEEARAFALAMRARVSPPTLETMRARVRGRLNALFRRSAQREPFHRTPSRYPITVDAYYERIPRPEMFARLRERLSRCLTNLIDQPLWEDIESGSIVQVHVIDSLVEFDVGGVPVYVAPDLVLRTADDRWLVVDWKTGAEPRAERQLELCALYLRSVSALPAGADACEGRIISLESGRSAEHRVTHAALDACARRVTSSVGRMRDLLADRERNVAHGLRRFPMTDDERVCRSCAFQQLCWPRGVPFRDRGGASADDSHREPDVGVR